VGIIQLLCANGWERYECRHKWYEYQSAGVGCEDAEICPIKNDEWIKCSLLIII
jgi:hypothetical protein